MERIDLQEITFTADVLRKLTLSDAGVSYLLDILTNGDSAELKPSFEQTDGLVVETYDDDSVLTWRDGCPVSMTWEDPS